MRTALVATVLTFTLAACGGGDDAVAPATTPETTETLLGDVRDRECGDTMSSAALALSGDGSPEDVDPAVIACASFDEFAAALADRSDISEADLRTMLSERCEQSDDPEVRNAAICEELASDAGA